MLSPLNGLTFRRGTKEDKGPKVLDSSLTTLKPEIFTHLVIRTQNQT